MTRRKGGGSGEGKKKERKKKYLEHTSNVSQKIVSNSVIYLNVKHKNREF